MTDRNRNSPDHDRDHRNDAVVTAVTFVDLGRQFLHADDPQQALQRLTEVATEVIGPVTWASITRGLSDQFVSVASSHPVASQADALQYRLGTGPCIDAVVNDAVFVSDDLALDTRWSQFGPQVARDHGVRSVLSLRLTVDGAGDDLNTALNLYADSRDAFDVEARYLATLLAAHAAVAIAVVVHRSNAAHYAQALASNREIGTAMGVLMATHRITREQAFDLLRVASQNTNRKLRDLAVDVADTGTLDLPRRG